MLKFTKMETDVKHRKARQKGRVSLLKADDNRGSLVLDYLRRLIFILVPPQYPLNKNDQVTPLHVVWGTRYLVCCLHVKRV